MKTLLKMATVGMFVIALALTFWGETAQATPITITLNPGEYLEFDPITIAEGGYIDYTITLKAMDGYGMRYSIQIVDSGGNEYEIPDGIGETNSNEKTISGKLSFPPETYYFTIENEGDNSVQVTYEIKIYETGDDSWCFGGILATTGGSLGVILAGTRLKSSK